MQKALAYLMDVAEFDRQVELWGYSNTSNFSRLSGIPRSTLMDYRAHSTCPSLPVIGKIMDMFPGLPIESFFRRNMECSSRVDRNGRAVLIAA